MKKISYVIPCYKSHETIEDVVIEINQTMENLKDYQSEIILVNDNPQDATYLKIKEIASKYKNIVGINLTRNFGQHAALMAGFHNASGDIIVCLDDDGQTPANEVGKLIEKIEEGYDVVYASYKKKKHSLFRNLGSKVNDKMAQSMIGKPKKLQVTSFFAARKIIIDEVKKYDNCYPYVIGLILRTTQNICNVEVTHRERKIGKSGYSFKKLIKLWLNGFTAFSVKPLRIATFLGIGTAFAGMIYLIYLIVNFFAFNSAPIGWRSLMVVLLVLGGVILFVLGLIGEYIGRSYICLNSSPQFVVRDVVKSEEKNDNESTNSN